MSYNAMEQAIANYTRLYKTSIEERLKMYGLDGAVCRVSDNVRGMLRVTENRYNTKTPYSVTFYPYKKDGQLSLNPSTKDMWSVVGKTVDDRLAVLARLFRKAD